MDALKAGDVLIMNIQGTVETKRRPVVVVSTDEYQQGHEDVIVGLLTTNLAAATTAGDHVLEDWAHAGLIRPSAFRAWLTTERQEDVIQRIGTLTQRDWEAITERLCRALAITQTQVTPRSGE